MITLNCETLTTLGFDIYIYIFNTWIKVNF
jgi:hypothetical protein